MRKWLRRIGSSPVKVTVPPPSPGGPAEIAHEGRERRVDVEGGVGRPRPAAEPGGERHGSIGRRPENVPARHVHFEASPTDEDSDPCTLSASPVRSNGCSAPTMGQRRAGGKIETPRGAVRPASPARRPGGRARERRRERLRRGGTGSRRSRPPARPRRWRDCRRRRRRPPASRPFRVEAEPVDRRSRAYHPLVPGDDDVAEAPRNGNRARVSPLRPGEVGDRVERHARRVERLEDRDRALDRRRAPSRASARGRRASARPAVRKARGMRRDALVPVEAAVEDRGSRRGSPSRRRRRRSPPRRAGAGGRAARASQWRSTLPTSKITAWASSPRETVANGPPGRKAAIRGPAANDNTGGIK